MEKHAEYLKAKKLAHPELGYEWGDYGFTIHIANLRTQKVADIFIIEPGAAGERQIDDAIDYLTGKSAEWFEVAPIAGDGAEVAYLYRRRSAGRITSTTGTSRNMPEADKQRLRDFMEPVGK